MSKNLTIKEAAISVDLPASTLRYYEKIGLIPKISRDDKGYRQYAESDLTYIRFVKCMQQSAMPLADMKRFAQLHYQQGDLTTRLQIIEQHLIRVEAEQKELEATRQFLLTKIRKFEAVIEERGNQQDGEKTLRQD